MVSVESTSEAVGLDSWQQCLRVCQLSAARHAAKLPLSWLRVHLLEWSVVAAVDMHVLFSTLAGRKPNALVEVVGLLLSLKRQGLVSSVREERLVNFEQGLLVVHKQVQDVGLVSGCEVCDLDPIFGKLGQSKQTLLKLLGLLTHAVDLLELLAVVDLVLEPALHDIFAHLLNTVDEESL